MADADKIRLADMLQTVGDEIARLEIWETVLGTEGRKLAAGQARALAVWRQTEQTILLLMEFERPFVDMVRQRRELARKQLAAIIPKTPTDTAPAREMTAPQPEPEPELTVAD